MSEKIIILPEYEELTEEVKKLRVKVPILLQERDTLIAVDCQNIKMKYMLLVGTLECQAFQEECDCRRTKCKMELIQEKINRREKITIEKIEIVLDEEFEEYQVRMDQKLHELNQMLERSKGKLLSDEETKELKDMYYRIVKALHPDMHPDISEEQKDLFLKAVDAYKNGDLITMRMINESVADPKELEKHDTLQGLKDEKDRLEMLVGLVKDDIKEIIESFPYNVKDMIDDDEWVEAQREALQSIIDGWKERNESYCARISEMIGG